MVRYRGVVKGGYVDVHQRELGGGGKGGQGVEVNELLHDGLGHLGGAEGGRVDCLDAVHGAGGAEG